MRLGHYAPPPGGDGLLLGVGALGPYALLRPAGATLALLDVIASEAAAIDEVYDSSGAMTTDAFAVTGAPVLLGGAISNDGVSGRYLTAGAVPFESAGTGADRKTIYIAFRGGVAGTSSQFSIFDTGAGVPNTGNHLSIYRSAATVYIRSYDAVSGDQFTSMGALTDGVDVVFSIELNGSTLSMRKDGGAASTHAYIPDWSGGGWSTEIGSHVAAYSHRDPVFRVFADGAAYSATVLASVQASLPAYVPPVNATSPLFHLDAAEAPFTSLIYDLTRLTQLAPLTVVGNPALTAGQFVFDGSNDSFATSAGNNPLESPASDNILTLYLVCSFDDASAPVATRTPFYMRKTAADIGFFLCAVSGLGAGDGGLTIYDSNYRDTGLSLADDTTYVVSVQCDGTDIKIRANGGTEYSRAGTLVGTGGYVEIGRNIASHLGTIDVCLVDNAAYSADLMQELLDAA